VPPAGGGLSVHLRGLMECYQLSAGSPLAAALDLESGDSVPFRDFRPAFCAHLRASGTEILLFPQSAMDRKAPLMLPLLAVSLLCGGCAQLDLNPTSWQLPTFASEHQPPGTPGWWKKQKYSKELVPGKGWRVAGVEGYFDDDGRPIDARVAKVVHQEEDEGLLSDAGVTQSIDSIKTRMGLGPDQQMAEEAYASGQDLFRRQEYGDAAKQFKQAAARWPDSRVEQDSMFFLAECQFFSTKYPEATEAYEALVKKFPNSSHLDNVIRRQFDIARYWEQHHQYKPHWATTPNLLDKTRPLFDTLGRSLKTYEGIWLNDPTGPLADDALMATANSHFLRGRYGDADDYYEQIRRDHPRSEHQYEAHVLGLQCKLREYQGPDYEGSPLEEAKHLAKQLKVQFAGELSDVERERLETIQAKLSKQLAMREYTMAKYYDDTKHYGSAKYYYARLVREYPQTELAEQARTRLAAIGGEPDHPAVPLEWFVKVFPENAERTAIEQVPMIGPQVETAIASRPETDGDASRGQTILR